MTDGPPGGGELHVARADELDAATLYALLRLRAEVFVVEQRCAYQDLDGRDCAPGTRHCWVERDGRAACYLRLVEEPGGACRLGRVATASWARGQGLATWLVRRALDLAGGEVVAGAQAQLVDWYRELGFTVTGPAYDEDGIAHVPMRHG